MREANNAASLFAHGLRVTRNMADDYADAVAAMSLLAIGAEKLLKLTIGIDHVGRTTRWPTGAEMKAIGHRIVPADKVACEIISRAGGTAPGHVAALLNEVEADPVLPNVLEALDRFGASGRFFFLDLLGDQPQQQLPPQMLWEQMTIEIAQSDPQLLAALSAVATYAQGRRELNAVIRTSLTRWWEAYQSAWKTGVVGKYGSRFARELDLMRQPAA